VQDRLVLDRLACIDEHVERLVLDLDEVGRVACELAGRSGDRGDGLAHEPRPADRQRVVLDVRARRRRHLEERIRVDRDLVAGDRSVDALERERRRDVDRDDLRVCVRRADEVDVARAVAANVVEEDALALDEPAVFLARDRGADRTLLELRRLGRNRRRSGVGLAHPFTEVIASTMFW
jgi:hypothetical protein